MLSIYPTCFGTDTILPCTCKVYLCGVYNAHNKVGNFPKQYEYYQESIVMRKKHLFYKVKVIFK